MSAERNHLTPYGNAENTVAGVESRPTFSVEKRPKYGVYRRYSTTICRSELLVSPSMPWYETHPHPRDQATRRFDTKAGQYPRRGAVSQSGSWSATFHLSPFTFHLSPLTPHLLHGAQATASFAYSPCNCLSLIRWLHSPTCGLVSTTSIVHLRHPRHWEQHPQSTYPTIDRRTQEHRQVAKHRPSKSEPSILQVPFH
jgi:hypothetical protein